eukprot:1077371-Pyramimonas_sp.AAC.1
MAPVGPRRPRGPTVQADIALALLKRIIKLTTWQEQNGRTGGEQNNEQTWNMSLGRLTSHAHREYPRPSLMR